MIYFNTKAWVSDVVFINSSGILTIIQNASSQPDTSSETWENDCKIFATLSTLLWNVNKLYYVI